MYLVQIEPNLWVNPQNVLGATVNSEGQTSLIYANGGADAIDLSLQELVEKINGEEMKYVITYDKDEDEWYCNVPGHSMQIGMGQSPVEALEEAELLLRVRSSEAKRSSKPPRGRPIADNPQA